MACLIAVAGLIGGVGAGALWDPHEVTVAELSRRIALNLWGGGRLLVAGADNSLPIRADLGRGELPFTSAALGFRVFGLSAWAGRLPLALWSGLGLGAIYLALSRLWDRRAGLYAVLVLATMPLYFLQARFLLGDAVTLATFAMAWAGMGAACLGSSLTGRARMIFLLLGCVGAYAGFWCRGPIVNVAVPALAIAVPAISARPDERAGRWIALGLAVVGVLSLVLGLCGLSLASSTGDYSVFVGSTLVALPELPTFDLPLGSLAHATFPWSAAAPLALWLASRREARSSQRRALIDAAALGLALSLAASAWLASSVGTFALPGVCCLAVLVACGLREVETGALGSPLLGVLVAACVLVIGFDLHQFPDKLLSGLALPGASLPEALTGSASLLGLGGACVLAIAASLSFYERRDSRDTSAARFDRAEYGRVLGAFQQVWDGNLVFALLVLEAALVGFLLLSAISERLVPLPQLESFGSFSRRLVALSAIALPLVPLLPIAAMLLRDLFRLLFDGPARRPHGAAPTRAQGLLLLFAALGGAGSLGFYPAFARQVSPKEAFERYRELRRGAEPLAVLGRQSGAARYQGAPDARDFDDSASAFDWLMADPASARRWLLIRSSDLAELNARHRTLRRHNLPVLDARSSELLLASNRHAPGDVDVNPLAELVLDTPPALPHALSAVLGDQLEVLGWALRNQSGQATETLVPTEHYRLAIYYRVLARLGESWQTFVHLDGLQRRFNADHEPLDGKYPSRYWEPGDVVVDSADISLEPNFTPGPYRLYFGLFSGERRLAVTRGPADDDRIVAGVLQVR